MPSRSICSLSHAAGGNAKTPALRRERGFAYCVVVRLDGCDLCSDLRLAVCSLVLVDDSLGDSLVELAARNLQLGLCGGLVAGSDCFAGCTDNGAELALVRLVALSRLQVGLDALDLRLNVCHVELCP